LDTKSAFDVLCVTFAELFEIKEKIGVKDKEEILGNLHKIESVLQCLF
jgi:hypothetical protein